MELNYANVFKSRLATFYIYRIGLKRLKHAHFNVAEKLSILAKVAGKMDTGNTGLGGFGLGFNLIYIKGPYGFIIFV